MNKYTYNQGQENKRTFFSRLDTIYLSGTKERELLEKAYSTAKEAFRNVKRDAGGRYFEHLRSVSLILIDLFGVTDHRVICSALLHDIVEDIDGWSVDRVELEFGVEIAYRVFWLTKPMDVLPDNRSARKKLFADRFLSAPKDVLLVKVADVLHNLSTMDGCSPEKKERFVREAREYFLPVVLSRGVHYRTLESAISLAEV